jgi:hypothetical protein
MSGDIEPPETEWERLIHKMAKLRADLVHLQEEVTGEDVPFEVQSTVNFVSSDYENLIRDFIEYEEGSDDMPDECPVCGEEIVQADELEAGESYDVDRMCISEKTAGGPGHGIIHWSKEAMVDA